MAEPYVSVRRLGTFLNGVKSLIAGSSGTLTRQVYTMTASSTGTQSFAIPGYNGAKMVVTVILNGFVMTPTTEYTISSTGTVSILTTVNSGGQLMFFVDSIS